MRDATLLAKLRDATIFAGEYVLLNFHSCMHLYKGTGPDSGGTSAATLPQPDIGNSGVVKLACDSRTPFPLPAFAERKKIRER